MILMNFGSKLRAAGIIRKYLTTVFQQLFVKTVILHR